MWTRGPTKTGAAGDPFAANVALLMHFESGFNDSSLNARTITTVGSPSISSLTPAFGSGCGDFTGGAEQYALVASSPDMSVGTGYFTLELQIKPTSLYPSGAGYYFHWGTSPGDIYIYSQFGNPSIYFLGSAVATPQILANVWNQISLTRGPLGSKIYINGILVWSAAIALSPMPSPAVMRVGAYPGGNKGSSAIDELRLTVGVERAITLQTAPFPNP